MNIIPFPSFGCGLDTPENVATFTDLVSAIYGSRSIGHSRDQFLSAAADLWDYIEHTRPTEEFER